MSKQREALKIALKVLNTKQDFNYPEFHALQYKAFNMVYEALAQPEQEPVAWRITDGEGDWDYRTELPEEWSIQWSARYGRKYEPLYTRADGNHFGDVTEMAAHKPLTDEQMRECAQAMDAEPLSEGWKELIKFARAIERAHGIGGEA